MGNVISLGYLVSFLVGLGAVWVVVPSAVVYLVLHRVRRGSWAIPYSIVDVVTWVAIGYVWFRMRLIHTPFMENCIIVQPPIIHWVP